MPRQENKKNRNILLVEDEVIIAMAQAETLKKYGYDLTTANSGEEALEVVKKHRDIDLILMDIDLGRGLDGIETAKRIISDKDIPVVFLSSHREPEIVEKTEKITSYGYVLKDSGITVLDASIKMAFKLHQANQTLLQHKNDLIIANEELQQTIEELEATNEQLIQSEKEIMQSEDELKKSELRFKTIFEHSPIAIGLVDKKGKPIISNPIFEKVMGYTSEEMASLSFKQFTHPDDLEKEISLYNELISGERET